MNQKIVIAISREYGSGGRTIGEMLSEQLGIHYYDKEILRLASDDSGINETLFVKAEDDFKKTRLFRTSSPVYKGELIAPGSKEFTSPENLFNYQAKVIKELADTKSCVIVGRCANFILKDKPNVVRVFVHAPKYYLLEQAALRQSLPPAELERFVDQENEDRAAYNMYHTGRHWQDAHNYDLCLDSSKLGFDKCCELIKGYMKVRFDGLEF